ncbi:TonB-dependent receptor plug domain-containing protein, partial [Arthrospira platensis SPKY1]|nr:TonB-dependent receptor plug domain-containing protein [Arthrospira platensis SPKY1]
AGGTFRGVSSIPLEDVERIEVLRGSNSAAYGAHAMLGVINIVTRHAADSQGGSLKVSEGTEGLRDRHARWGWQTDSGHHRISLHQRSDDGYANLPDARQIDGLTWRGDWQMGGGHEWPTFSRHS